MEKKVSALSKLIRETRSEMGISRDALARKISSAGTELTGKSIQNYEEGKREPELLPLIQIILVAPEPQQSALSKYLPTEVLRLAARLAEAVPGPFGSEVTQLLSPIPPPPGLPEGTIEPAAWKELWLLARALKRDVGYLLSQYIDGGVRLADPGREMRKRVEEEMKRETSKKRMS